MTALAELPPINHGTPGGYQVHWKRGQKPCKACREAKRLYQQELRARNKEFRETMAKRNAAAWRARKVLSELHRAEYHKLYQIELEKVGLK